MKDQDKTAEHIQHTLEILLEAPGPGTQGTLHGRALQDLFSIRPLPSRIGYIADFPNTEKQAQRLRQIRRQINLSQMKEQDKATARHLGEIDISDIPDVVFKALIIRILTGLEKRVEDMSETLNTEIKSNIAEMKVQ